MLNLISLIGLVTIVGLCALLSNNRRAISWRLVASGLVIQTILGGVFLYWEAGNRSLRAVGDGVKEFLELSSEGTKFAFGLLGDPARLETVLGSVGFGAQGLGFIFVAQVLPVLIFFSAFMGVLYHVGLMQWIVRMMAIVMARVMGTSGSESLSACGNVFVGQTEAPMMVRPFLQRMTMSELHTVMTGGFATIAGSVFALYVAFGIDPGHMMVASVMAVPAGLICSKVLWPETEASETMGRVVATTERVSRNVVEAAASGAADGLKLALNVGAMLIAFLGLMAVANWAIGHVGDWLGVQSWLFGSSIEPGWIADQRVVEGWIVDQPVTQRLSLDLILGWLFSPIAAVMGVPFEEVPKLGELLGKKLILTELVAYQELGQIKDQLSPRTVLIASFALCGFANIGSAAIQIGGLGAMAPDRRSDIARLAFRAMFAGALATCMTACLAGALSDV